MAADKRYPRLHEFDGQDYVLHSDFAELRTEHNQLSSRCESLTVHQSALQQELEKWQGIAGRRTGERSEFINERNDAQERLAIAEQLMQEFCDRVDRGEVRSKSTYAKFKAALTKNTSEG